MISMGMCLCITWYYLSFESDATLLWWDDVVAGGCWWREEVMNIMGVWINQRQLASNSLCSKFRQKLNWFLATAAAAAAGSMDLFTPTNHIMDFVIDQTGALWTRTLFILVVVIVVLLHIIASKASALVGSGKTWIYLWPQTRPHLMDRL